MGPEAAGAPPGAVYRRTPGTVERTFRGSVLMIDPSGESLLLEGVAALVWIVLDEPADHAEVVGRIEDAADLVGAVSHSLIDEALETLIGCEVVTTADVA